jgi:hypothetical protein
MWFQIIVGVSVAYNFQFYVSWKVHMLKFFSILQYWF